MVCWVWRNATPLITNIAACVFNKILMGPILGNSLRRHFRRFFRGNFRPEVASDVISGAIYWLSLSSDGFKLSFDGTHPLFGGLRVALIIIFAARPSKGF